MLIREGERFVGFFIVVICYICTSFSLGNYEQKGTIIFLHMLQKQNRSLKGR
jgi:hypothetical protein